MWATEIQKVLKWFAKFEIVASPSGTMIRAQAKATTNKRWKTIVKTADEAAILMQATEDDLEHFEKFQQEGAGFSRIKSWCTTNQYGFGLPTMPEMLQKQQAMRMHEATKHQTMHVAYACMPATNCMACMSTTPTRKR